jgi:hypothetical protein
MRLSLPLSTLILAAAAFSGPAHAVIYDDNQVCRAYFDLGEWNMQSAQERRRYIDISAKVPNPKLIVGMRATIYSDPYPAGCNPATNCKTRSYSFDRYTFHEDGTNANRASYGLGGNIYYSKDTNGAWRIVLDRGDNFINMGFFVKANIPLVPLPEPTPENPNPVPDPNELINFASKPQNRGVLEIEYIGTKGSTGAQGDSTLLYPTGPWQMSDNPAQYPQSEKEKMRELRFGNFQYSAREMLGVGSAIFSDLSNGSFNVDRFDRGGGKVANSQTGRGGIPVFGDNGAGFGFMWLKQHIGGVESGHQHYRPDIGASAGSKGYASLADNRGYFLVRFKGLKNGSAYNGFSASYDDFPYALKSKAITLDNWDMTASTNGFLDKTFNISSLGLNNRRLVNFQVTINSDPIAAEANRQEVFNLRMINDAYPADRSSSTAGPGRPYWIDGGNLKVSAAYSASADFFLSDSKNRFALATGVRGFLKVDYIAAQCSDRVSGVPFPNFNQLGSGIGGECGGGPGSTSNSDQVVQSSGGGFALTGGSTDNVSFLHRAETQNNVILAARLDNVEKTADGSVFGLTMRGGTSNAAMHATIVITPGQGLKAMTRTGIGGSTTTTTVAGIKTPVWARIQKTGKVFLMEYRTGATGAWIPIAVRPIASFPTSYNLGFVGASATGQACLSTGSASGVSIAYMSGFAKYKNRWLNTYMHTQNLNGSVQNGNLGAPDWTSAQWALEAVDGTYVRVRNRASGQYMHNENQTGRVQYGALNTSWSSMQWTVEVVGGYLRLRNRWKPDQWIHTENNNGYAQTGNVPSNYFSSHWTFEPMP